MAGRFLGDVQHQADTALRGDGRIQHQREGFDLGPLPFVLSARPFGDEVGLGFHQRFDDAEAVGAERLPVSVTSTMASANVGGLTSVAPQLNSTLTGTPLAAK